MNKIKKHIVSFIVLSFIFVFLSTSIFAAINFGGGQQSATYDLSNGSRIRIEYHYGEPHVHDDTKGGSENIVDGKAHHTNEDTLPKSTKDILTGKDKKNKKDDTKARKKYGQYKDEREKQNEDSKKAKEVAEKNKAKIEEAHKTGAVFVIIGFLVFVVKILIWILSGGMGPCPA